VLPLFSLPSHRYKFFTFLLQLQPKHGVFHKYWVLQKKIKMLFISLGWSVLGTTVPSVLRTARGQRPRALCKTWGTVFPNNYGPPAWWITYLSASVKLNIYRKHDTSFERHFGITHAIFSLFKLNGMILYTLLNYKTSENKCEHFLKFVKAWKLIKK